MLNLLNEAKWSKQLCTCNQKIEHLQWSIKRKLCCRKWNCIWGIEVLKSNLCNFNDTYILATGDITILGRNGATQVAFKNCAPFTKWITKIDRITIGDAEVSDLVMLLHNLIEYSSNYSDTTGSL